MWQTIPSRDAWNCKAGFLIYKAVPVKIQNGPKRHPWPVQTPGRDAARAGTPFRAVFSDAMFSYGLRFPLFSCIFNKVSGQEKYRVEMCGGVD